MSEYPRPNWKAWPEQWAPRFNAGIRCDMLVGPCACGATHNGETPPDVGPYDDDYYAALAIMDES